MPVKMKVSNGARRTSVVRRVEMWRGRSSNKAVSVCRLVATIRCLLLPLTESPVSTSPSSVGSKTGAPIHPSYGCITFPTPSSSNAAGGFPALRSPACFMPRFMGPITLVPLLTQGYAPGSPGASCCEWRTHQACRSSSDSGCPARRAILPVPPNQSRRCGHRAACIGRPG